MIVLYFVVWLVLACLALFFLIILTPVRYDLRGYWQEEFSGDLRIGAGPLRIGFKLSTEGNNIFSLGLAGIILWKKPISKMAGMEKKKEPSPKKKAEKASFRDAFDFLDKGFIKALLRMAGDIFRHSAPQALELKGFWGFNDPYYTGLLAAVKTVIPGIQVEPDFTREVRDLKVLIKGRIRPAVLIFYGLRLLFSRQLWPLLKKMWQKRKINKKMQPPVKPGVLNR